MPLGFVTRLAQSLISTLDVLKLGSIEIPNIDVKFNINIRCIEMHLYSQPYFLSMLFNINIRCIEI